jgi:CRISP-associated protein Cas1
MATDPPPSRAASPSAAPASQDDAARPAEPDADSPRAKALPRRLPIAGDPPPLVPARMINEALYCERLLYLEWAQGEWDDNVFTVDGKVTHRRADKPSGTLPDPPGETSKRRRGASAAAAAVEADPDAPRVARSVWLSDEALGITSKIDVVEAEGGRVTPIEYKRGEIPDVPEGAYLPERAQVGAQILLLRAHGHACDEGAIYFAKSRRRVAVPLDAELERVVRAAAARAREVTALAEAPPPLVSSPKCMGCSLAAICLPDEVEMLRELEGRPPVDDDADAEPSSAPELRRLVPARDDKVPLYVQDTHGRVGLEGEELVIRTKDKNQRVRLAGLSQVSVFGSVQISTQAIRELLQRGIPTAFFSFGGFFYGYLAHLGSKNVELRVAQHRAAGDRAFCLRVARELVISKIKNARTMLRRNAEGLTPRVLDDLTTLTESAERAERIESLLGVEGTAARLYFAELPKMLRASQALGERFDREGRNRRPPRDPLNAMLSFVYALLTKDVTVTLVLVGLDPLLGVYHQPRFGRPALALDLMEELRPIVADSVVISAINNGVIGEGDFIERNGAANLTDAARKRLVLAYERRMDLLVTHPVFGYRVSYRRVLEVQARLFGRVCTGEVDAYPGLRTR